MKIDTDTAVNHKLETEIIKKVDDPCIKIFVKIYQDSFTAPPCSSLL